MKDTLNRFLVPALLALAVVIISLNAWVAFRSLDVLLAQEDWVQHTWKVINQTEIIMGSMRDAENGERGFLITDDDEYLAPYTRALELLPGQLARLQQLTVDDSSQQHRIVELRAIITERLSLLQQGINLRRNGRSDSLHALVITGTGNMQMNRLRTLTEEMDKEEQRLLDMRVVEARASAVRTRVTMAVASTIDLLLIILMFRYFVRERSMRMASEESAARLAIAIAEAKASADEVKALNATLEERVRARTDELENTNRELEAFSYSVSHDLRAPLRTIDGFSAALEEDYVHTIDDTGRDYIHRVRAGVQRMGELIDALLQLSRITRASLTREHIDLTALTTSVARDLQEQNRGRRIVFHIQPRLEVDADPGLLRVALENLLGNAVKFTSRKEEAVIDFGWDAEKNAWFVRDNGAGFDMSYAGKLFTAFNRLHGDRDFKGSGIGLATVARVVHRHLGTIWADGVVDHGATFWFTLG